MREVQCHRHQEFIRFLNTVEREVAADKAVHEARLHVRQAEPFDDLRDKDGERRARR